MHVRNEVFFLFFSSMGSGKRSAMSTLFGDLLGGEVRAAGLDPEGTFGSTKSGRWTDPCTWCVVGLRYRHTQNQNTRARQIVRVRCRRCVDPPLVGAEVCGSVGDGGGW